MRVKIIDFMHEDSYMKVGNVIREYRKDYLVDCGGDDIFLVHKSFCFPVILENKNQTVISLKN